MTASSARPGQQVALSAPQHANTNSEAHHVPTNSPLDVRVDALGVQMLMADRFLLNIILE